jgi:hypothetical protein
LSAWKIGVVQERRRSAKLSKYDMQTIFRLTKRPLIYKSREVVYHQYCTLLKSLTPQVFGEDTKIYKLEMLLFMVAPTDIVGQIESSVSLKLVLNIIQAVRWTLGNARTVPV